MSSKPQITATIKFRGVTIENMTVDELRELRDVLNTLVGKETEYIPYPQPYPVYPVYPRSPIWTITCGNTTSGNTLIMDDDNTANYTIRCN